MNIKYYTFLSKFLCLRLSRPSRSPGMENVIQLGAENTPQPLLTETLLRPLVRGQDELVLYCTVLYCTVLNCTVLYCTVLTETLLRPLVRGQYEVVVEAELGAAVQPGTGTVVIIVCL